ncbi:hypothetical protein [Georgenia sp. AZ-5]|uniref:hypothetical protein n=1 Tax=Georgenia sp. AZ-5 TaxID=3367526 RepID=UPI0037543A8C
MDPQGALLVQKVREVGLVELLDDRCELLEINVHAAQASLLADVHVGVPPVP